MNDFKSLCVELSQDKRDLLVEEFESKRNYIRLTDAYPNRRERLIKLAMFSAAGLIDRSWKRSIGKLATADQKAYRRQWHRKHMDAENAFIAKSIAKSRRFIDRETLTDTQRD